MYAKELREQSVGIDAVYLDPNNPRFWTEQTTREVPDRKIPEEDVQARTLNQIQEHGVQELSDSILRNGFLPLDRIVVRPIEGHHGKYVAVEGNRRLAALKTLRQRIDDDLVEEEHITEEYLQQLKAETDTISVLVYTGSATADISWLLQGVRHISGIRGWEPAQRAKLVASQIEKEGLKFREAGQRFGLTAQAVGRLYRSYKALEQMRSDEEFQPRALNEYFTLFEEATRNNDVRKWLGWDDKSYRFTNADNVKQFYSWITPDEDHPDKRRRIHDPRQIKEVGYLIAGGHQALLSQFDAHEITVATAYDRATQVGQKFDWEKAIDRACDLLAEIPQSAIANAADAVLARLASIQEQIRKLRLMAEAVKEAS